MVSSCWRLNCCSLGTLGVATSPHAPLYSFVLIVLPSVWSTRYWVALIKHAQPVASTASIQLSLIRCWTHRSVIVPKNLPYWRTLIGRNRTVLLHAINVLQYGTEGFIASSRWDALLSNLGTSLVFWTNSKRTVGLLIRLSLFDPCMYYNTHPNKSKPLKVS